MVFTTDDSLHDSNWWVSSNSPPVIRLIVEVVFQVVEPDFRAQLEWCGIKEAVADRREILDVDPGKIDGSFRYGLISFVYQVLITLEIKTTA